MANITVCINGLRINMLNDLSDVICNIQPLVESYKKGMWESQMTSDEARDLFESINNLRSNIACLMCCYSESIVMSNLSDLTDDLDCIKFDNNEDEK